MEVFFPYFYKVEGGVDSTSFLLTVKESSGNLAVAVRSVVRQKHGGGLPSIGGTGRTGNKEHERVLGL